MNGIVKSAVDGAVHPLRRHRTGSNRFAAELEVDAGDPVETDFPICRTTATDPVNSAARFEIAGIDFHALKTAPL